MTAEASPARKRLPATIALVLAVLIASACQSPAPEREAARPPTTTTSTSTTVSREERVVYVYRQDVPVDALPASPLARQGILLPVPQCGEVPQNTLDALRKIGATAVRRIGGPEAVCDDVIRQLEAAIA